MIGRMAFFNQSFTLSLICAQLNTERVIFFLPIDFNMCKEQPETTKTDLCQVYDIKK